MSENKNIIKLLIRILFPCLLAGTFAYLFLKFIKIFLPFVIAWFISLLIIPLVKKINKKLKVNNKFFNRLIVIITIGGAVALISFIIYKFLIFIPDICTFLYDKLNNFNIDESKMLFLSNGNFNFTNIENFISEHSSMFLDISQKALDIIQNVPQAIIRIVVCLLATYYFVVDELDLNKILIKFIPESFLSHYDLIKENAKNMFIQYFVAQFKISGVIFIVLVIGFGILKIDNFFVITLLTTILDWLPVFGTGTVIWPWAIYCVLTGKYSFALGLMIIYFISQAIRQVIQPKLISDTVGVSSITTLFFMYVGFLLAGIGGMIIAVPIGVFCINLAKAGMFNNWINDVKSLIQIVYKKLYE